MTAGGGNKLPYGNFPRLILALRPKPGDTGAKCVHFSLKLGLWDRGCHWID